MRKANKAVTTGLAVAAVTVSLVGLATPAKADPVPAPPPFRTYAAVGSDTIQDVWNGLTNGTPPVISDIASWDAFGDTNCVQTRDGGPKWQRPAGSLNGAKFLSDAYDPDSTTQWPTCSTDDTVDSSAQPTSADIAFARSSAQPSVPGDDLLYIPFVRDAVTVAWKTTAVTSVDFSLSELQELYTGVNDPSNGDHVQIVGSGDSAVAEVDDIVVHPVLPQPGSGTRQFFQAAIGVPDGNLADYVDPNSTIPENHGDALAASDIIPFSGAQWIAQKNGAATDTTAGLVLATIDGNAAYQGTAPDETPGPLFGHTDSNGHYDVQPTLGGAVGEFFRDTYNVIPASDIGSSDTAVQALVNILTGSDSGDLFSPAALTVETHYGFGQLSYGGSLADALGGAFVH